MRTRLRSPLLEGSSDREGAGPGVSGWVRLPVRVLRRLCDLSPCMAIAESASLFLQLHANWRGSVVRLSRFYVAIARRCFGVLPTGASQAAEDHLCLMKHA